MVPVSEEDLAKYEPFYSEHMYGLNGDKTVRGVDGLPGHVWRDAMDRPQIAMLSAITLNNTAYQRKWLDRTMIEGVQNITIKSLPGIEAKHFRPTSPPTVVPNSGATSVVYRRRETLRKHAGLYSYGGFSQRSIGMAVGIVICYMLWAPGFCQSFTMGDPNAFIEQRAMMWSAT